MRHSEFNPSTDEAVHFLQIWIEPEKNGLKPRYADKSLADLPKGRFNLVASKAGRDGSIAINQDADLYLAKLEPGDTAAHKLRPGRHAWLHVAEGEVMLDGDLLRSGDAVGISDETLVRIGAKTPAQVLLFDLN